MLNQVFYNLVVKSLNQASEKLNRTELAAEVVNDMFNASDLDKAKLVLALLESIPKKEDYRALAAEHKDAIKSIENMIAIGF